MFVYLKKNQIPIIIINAIALIIFTIIYLNKHNYEFILYVGVIIFFITLILFTNKRINFPNIILWGLTFWSLLHMAGGGLFYKDKKLYELMLIPIIAEPYYIFKYDQLVHIIGFGTATLTMYFLLKPLLINNFKGKVRLSIVIIMAGLGVGAFNEIIEFIATVAVPETGVGGYINTSLDLISNMIGGILAIIYILNFDLKKKS